VAAALRRQHRAWICSVDVGPFRRAAGPYVTYDGNRLPFADLAFDTTLLLLTLHHCAEPDAVLREAVRVTRQRLIVMESVHRTPYERFWLYVLDAWLNAYRHGGGMAVPLTFRSPSEWRRSFQLLRLRVVSERWLGSWWERLVHQPVMFVLDRAPDGGLAVSETPLAWLGGEAQIVETGVAPLRGPAFPISHGCDNRFESPWTLSGVTTTI
jgi:SAM-dependent methyltransferase